MAMARIRHLTLLAALTLAGALALPSPASASSTQISIFEDSAVFLGLTERDPDAALGEARALGADAIRMYVSWRRASFSPAQYTVPRTFDPADAYDPLYNWGPYDQLVRRARAHGLKVIVSIGPAMPYWGSREPRRCPHPVGNKVKNGLSCYWKPDPVLFGKFVKAVATRYRGQVAFYSLWNEPNLENYLLPQRMKTSAGIVDMGGKQLRELFIAGYRAIRAADRPRAKKVLFGETSAISSPRDTLFSALCLNRRGRPYKGAIKRLQGCSRPKMLPIAGLAVHPYNRSALGTVFSTSKTRASMPMGYLSRADRLLALAEKYKRVPKKRGIYITEFGFQSRPANARGLSPEGQAQALNEADRLFYDDKRIKSTAQFELYDVPDVGSLDIFNTGLRQQDGVAKPALAAWRLPLVVTRRRSNRVEVWGQVRPASKRVRAVVEAARKTGGPFRRLKRVRTNRAGYFRFELRRAGAARLHYRVRWNGHASRVAKAGRKIRYRKG